jgi:hypothetical protein
MAPGGMHAYKVACMQCDRFFKWGTSLELASIKAAGKPVELIPYQPPATLEKFFE